MLEDRAVSGGEVAVYLVDLDSFKPINDTYSQDAGDEVLIQTAQRLRKIVGTTGIVGRLGGDEFICAVEGINWEGNAILFAEQLATVIKQPIKWSERTLKTRASIDVAMTGPGQSTTVVKLCLGADQAMFAAKSAPSGRPVLYQAHLFAPRMTPEDKQALSDFMMSMAEQVIEDVNTMLDRDLDPGQVSLNVSKVALATLTGRQELLALIEANPKAAVHLTFEITEDVFIARAADTIQASIAAFRLLGVRISLDDFGTGFASFHHLRQLDFDELKIDTTFIDGLGHDATAEVLLRGFSNIASGLGVSVVAEGVETANQSCDLINMGCLTAQGYLFSAAVPMAKVTDLLVNQQAA
jgi:diguanylate cyclase (GGDEF)-like protein